MTFIEPQLVFSRNLELLLGSEDRTTSEGFEVGGKTR